MILLHELLTNNVVVVYRGVDPSHGDTELGHNSVKIGDKLVAALGPNHTDNIEIAKVFGKKVVQRELSGNPLRLNHYNDVLELYRTYERQLSPGLARNIKQSSGAEQLKYIQQAGKELRTILSRKYGYIVSPMAVSDEHYLSQKGLRGNLYIPLN